VRLEDIAGDRAGGDAGDDGAPEGVRLTVQPTCRASTLCPSSDSRISPEVPGTRLIQTSTFVIATP
jgi:hypothetical protein